MVINLNEKQMSFFKTHRSFCAKAIYNVFEYLLPTNDVYVQILIAHISAQSVFGRTAWICLLWACVCGINQSQWRGAGATRSMFVRLFGESLPVEPVERSNGKLRIRVG